MCTATPQLFSLYRVNPNYLQNPKCCVGCFAFHLGKIVQQHLKQGQNRGEIFHFCNFVLRNSILRSCFWHTESKAFFIFALFLCPTQYFQKLVVHSFCCHWKGPGVPWIAVHFYTGMQLWIIWTLGLQSMAQTSTNKRVFRMIQAYQFFNEPVPKIIHNSAPST